MLVSFFYVEALYCSVLLWPIHAEKWHCLVKEASSLEISFLGILARNPLASKAVDK